MPIAGWGFAPALAAGNTVVLKPAELTPLTAIRLGELALEAGLPRGRVHRHPGPGLGGRGAVRRPTRRCARSASPAPPRSARRSWPAAPIRSSACTLELGGKSANVIFADADLANGRGVAHRTRSSTTPARTAAPDPGSWSRRRCTSEFLDLLEPAVERLRVSDPRRPPTRDGSADLGRAPRPGPRLPRRRRRRLRRRRSRRSRVLVAADGGAAPLERRPRSGARRSSARWSPCCRSPTRPKRSRLANDTEYGLSGSIFTRDLGRALRVSRASSPATSV